MTESVPQGKAAYSKDYWDIVLSQMRRRPSVRISLVLLALVYAVSIYAPFLAGDRPLLLQASDAASYRKAQKQLPGIALNLKEILTGGPAAWAAKSSTQSWSAAVSGECEGLENRARSMREQVHAADSALLDELLAQAAAVRAAASASDVEAATQQGGSLVEVAQRIRSELTPTEAGQTPEPGKTIALAVRTTYPVFAAISRGELYFMGLWLVVLLWPAWNWAVNRLLLRGDREAIRRARRRKLLVVSLLPLLPLAFWSSAEDPYATSAYKAGLTSGEIVAARVVFPPIPFGLAEINDSEFLRPPTWHQDAEIGEDGYYVRGARSARTDVQTGFSVPGKPVFVHSGEPPRNDPRRHLLGTDSVGRDLLTRLVWGGRVSLSVGLVSTLFLVVIGVILGALAGYYGGVTDAVISRIIEIVQCFPAFFLILIVVAFVGPDIMNIMLILGITRWPGVARLVRGEFLRLRGQDFVVASEALGVRQGRTIFRHILPNAMGPVLVTATFSVASGILIESALSYLGLGIRLPVPSWGSLFIESSSAEHWWIQIYPGLMIFLTVVLYNLLGEGVADALDPRQKI